MRGPRWPKASPHALPIRLWRIRDPELIAADLRQRGTFFFAVHAAGGDRHAHGVAQTNDRFDDGRGIVVLAHMLNKRGVDFDFIHRKLIEMPNTGVADAKILYGNFKPVSPQRLQNAEGVSVLIK